MSTPIEIPMLVSQDVVFFPHTTISLHISDSVTKRMVSECVEQDRPVGLALARNSGRYPEDYNGRFHPMEICTIGRPVILDEDNAGVMRILIHGIHRVRLIDVKQNLPYPIYRAEALPDVADQGPICLDKKISQLKEVLDQWAMEQIAESLEREKFFMNMAGDVHELVDTICSFMITDSNLRQIMLENITLSSRIRILSSIFKDGDPFWEDVSVVNGVFDFSEIQKTNYVIHH